MGRAWNGPILLAKATDLLCSCDMADADRQNRSGIGRAWNATDAAQRGVHFACNHLYSPCPASFRRNTVSSRDLNVSGRSLWCYRQWTPIDDIAGLGSRRISCSAQSSSLRSRRIPGSRPPTAICCGTGSATVTKATSRAESEIDTNSLHVSTPTQANCRFEVVGEDVVPLKGRSSGAKVYDDSAEFNAEIRIDRLNSATGLKSLGRVVMTYGAYSDTVAEWVYGDGSLWIYDSNTAVEGEL